VIILDTHVLVWWISDPHKLSQNASEIIESEKNNGKLFVSSISVWEIYMLISKGRLKLSMDTDEWISRIEKLPFVEFIPVNNRIAGKSVLLPGEFHSDPVDRIIVATARDVGARLVSCDDRIRGYSEVQCVW